MGYIPIDAKWYLGEIVQQITVEGDPRHVVHTNVVLIRADSPEEAHAKAVELGMSGNTPFKNPAGRLVTITYRGLHDLNVIHDELKHGAELIFEERIETDETGISRHVLSRDELGVFAKRKPRVGPDYASGEVLDELREKFPNLDWNNDSDNPA